MNISMTKLLVEFQPTGKRTFINAGETVLDAAQSAGVGLTSVCGGAGTCEECRIKVITGTLTPPTQIEKISLGDESIKAGWRLACQSFPLRDVKLLIPTESMTTVQRLQVDGEDKEFLLDPLTQNPGSFGLAVDVGTTKVAVYLIDLSNGHTVAKDGFMNPQVSYGEDVISRISYAGRVSDGAIHLQQILIQSINQVLPFLCKQVGISQDQIQDLVFVGNTVMHHLAAGLPVEQLGYSPFSPATLDSVSISSVNLGIKTSTTSQVYFPPVIAGYVGADHLAMLLAIDAGLLLNQTIGGRGNSGSNRLKRRKDNLFSQKSNIIAIDIGTNTEISLITPRDITCCSCASGPAFEGAHIQEGMRASPGAIERVMWKDGKILWQTIDSQPPVGICGSGILDVVASLLQGNVIKSTGQLLGGNVYSVVIAKESGLGRDIVVTRKDVHEIQLAKAAIRSAIDILLQHSGLRFEDLDEFIIAGAFGTYLDSKSAVRIGMFPPVPMEKFQQIGNAAGVGAKKFLLSVKARREAELLAKRICYLELATNKEFQDIYIRNLSFHKQ
jgi:uncharacterized 2Fe-2S/4Fe-4S cluster protein (DUF4445 family)